MAAWNLGLGLVGAASVGANTTAWVTGAEAEINELDSPAYYDVLGLAGAVYGLAYVGVDFDPTAGKRRCKQPSGSGNYPGLLPIIKWWICLVIRL